jgi:hypothetical protein
MDLELAPGLRLQLAHRRLDVAVDDMRVPTGIPERRRGHVLGQDVDPVGDGIRLSFVVPRPVGLEDLPRPAPEEQRVRPLEHRADEAPGLLVEVRGHPAAALEPAAPVFVGTPGTLVDAVDGQHHRGGQLHGHRSLRVVVDG